MPLEDWRDSQEARGLECAQEDNTNPDAPPGFTLTCERMSDGAALSVRTDYAADGQPRRVHATVLPGEPGGSITTEAQTDALSVVVAYQYPDSDPEAALIELGDFLSDPNCQGTDCVAEIGGGTFRLQTGEGGAWVVTLELGGSEQ
jgi:hypothetical protein